MPFAASAITATAIATGIGAYSSVQQGKSQRMMAEFEAERLAAEAKTTEEASEYEERQSRVEGRQLKARQLLQFAKGGVVPGAGSPLLVQEETSAEVLRNINLQKYGYGLQTSRFMSESKLQKMMGKSRSRASRWQAGSSLLTGAYRASSIYT